MHLKDGLARRTRGAPRASIPTRLWVRLDEVLLVIRGLRIHAPFEIEELDLSKVGRRRFGLDGDVAGGHGRPVDLDGRIERLDSPAADLRLGVLDHRAAVDDV